MGNLNTARLKSQLLTSGLQQKDSALFQVINSLIGGLDTLNAEINGIVGGGSGGSGGSSGDNITNIISGIGPPGADGTDGDDGSIGPTGLQGIQGAIGAGGPAGPTTIGPMGIDGTDGDDGMPIPGPQGLQGPIGPIGPAGPTTIGPMGLDGEDGLDGYSIPGRDGTSGGGGSSGWTLIAQQTAAGAANYDFTNLSAYNDLRVIIKSIVLSTSGQTQLHVSINNGSSFLISAGDYININAAGGEVNSTNLRFISANTTAAHSGQIIIYGFNMSNPKMAISNADVNFHMRYIPTTSACDAIRVSATLSANLNSGTIYVFGR